MAEFLRLTVFGGIIGIANAIPGVSGGTLAVVLGIYDKLIGSISGFLKDIKGSIKFLLPVGIGAGIGIVLFGSLIEYLITYFAMPTNFFFFGLIVGSLPMIYKKAKSMGSVRSYHYLAFLLACGMMVALAIVGDTGSTEVVETLTLSHAVTLIVAAFIAATGMLLPGVSGSMLLLIMGQYFTIITAVSNFNIIILAPVGIGVALGLSIGAILINFCLTRFPVVTYYAILGMVIGSLIPVLENAFASGSDMSQMAVAIPLLVVGILISLWFEKFSRKSNHK